MEIRRRSGVFEGKMGFGGFFGGLQCGKFGTLKQNDGLLSPSGEQDN